MWEKMPDWRPSAPDPSWGKKKGGLVVGDSGSERFRDRERIKSHNPKLHPGSQTRGRKCGNDGGNMEDVRGDHG